MTSDALVRAILTEEECELYDRVRIINLFNNVIKGYGKLLSFPKHISITYTGSKAKKVIYNIPKVILTDKQLAIASSFTQ